MEDQILRVPTTPRLQYKAIRVRCQPFEIWLVASPVRVVEDGPRLIGSSLV